MAEGESVSIWADEEGRLHVGVMVKGKRIHRRLPKGSSKGDAKQLEAQLIQAAGRKQVNIPGDPPMEFVMGLYLEHCDSLRSPETAKFHALRCGPWMTGTRASQAEDTVRKMVKDLKKAYKPATINKSIGTVKTALKLAFEEKHIPADYGASIKRLAENNQRHEYLTVEQVKEIANHCSDTVRAAVWIALLTGARRGEILKLSQEDIIGNRLRIRSGNTKTLKERTVPIVPALKPWLPYIPFQINYEGLKTGFRRAREKAGYPHIHFHDLRHSCASILINMKPPVPLEVVRDILGHATVKTTERYAHLQVDQQEKALNKLSKIVLSV
jgi:integrase